MNFSSLTDVTVASFLPPCLAHQMFTMLAASSRGLSIARLFSVVRFLVSPQAQFVLSTLLVVHGPNWLLALREALGVVGQPWVSTVPTCRWTRLVFGRDNNHRSQNVHRHVLRVALVAPTSRVRVQRTSSLTNHQQVCSSPANGGADARRPVGGRASLS